LLAFAEEDTYAFRKELGQSLIQSWCDEEFAPVAQRFAANFAQRDELGASLCIIYKGRVITDLWGGLAEAETCRRWDRDTISVIFSATKAATALCIHLLAQRGRIELDSFVADYWPEYGAASKAATTIRMVLDHTAGVPALREPLKPDCLTDHTYMAERIAAAEPFWDPGSRTAYHPLTMGFILAEILRRIDGRSLGRFFADEIGCDRSKNHPCWCSLPAYLSRAQEGADDDARN